MDEHERAPDLAIAERTKPAHLRVRVMFDPPTDRLNHQNVRQPRHDGFAARPQRPRLVGHETQHWVEPLQLA
jgi:hypothetical protein